MIISYSFLFVHSFWIVSCVWVQISNSNRSTRIDSVRTSTEISKVPKSSSNHPMYNHFFSIFEPQMNLSNCSENNVQNYFSIQPPIDSRDIVLRNQFSTDPIKSDTFLFSNTKKQKEKRIKTTETHRAPMETTKSIDARNIAPNLNNFNSVPSFFRSVQKSFLMNVAKGIQNKTKLLNHFKKSILFSIGVHFKSLWPQGKNYRIRRSPNTHELDFPSAETALMTISFLTLAVFLIKLVLQVINTIKSKHVGLQTMTPTSVNETPIKIIKTNRNARKLSLYTLSTTGDLQSVTDTIKNIEDSVISYA